MVLCLSCVTMSMKYTTYAQSRLALYLHGGCGKHCFFSSIHILHLASVDMLHLNKMQKADMKQVSQTF